MWISQLQNLVKILNINNKTHCSQQKLYTVRVHTYNLINYALICNIQAEAPKNMNLKYISITFENSKKKYIKRKIFALEEYIILINIS